MKASKWFLALTAAASLAAAPAMAADEEFQLSFQTMYAPAQQQMKDVFEPFIREVEKRSNGTLKIDLFGVGALVPALEEADSVRAGNLDMGQTAMNHPKETPYLYLLNMVPDMCLTVEDTIKVGPLLYDIPELKREIDRYGVPFAFTSYVPQIIASVNSPIRTPADLKGKRMLVTAPNQAMLAEAWGAIPVMVSLSDVYIGLQRGMGEAYMSGLSWHKGSKIYEVARYMTNIGYPNTNVMPFLINRDLFEELSENQRNVLMETAREFFNAPMLASWNSDFAEATRIFAENGVTLYNPTEEELAQWHEANARVISPSLERLRELGVNDGEAFLKRVEATLEEKGFYAGRQ